MSSIRHADSDSMSESMKQPGSCAGSTPNAEILFPIGYASPNTGVKSFNSTEKAASNCRASSEISAQSPWSGTAAMSRTLPPWLLRSDQASRIDFSSSSPF